ncbi:MAG: 2-C-methyl-D-erythritol 2,4-cyclodiphosphate synthase, partial [Rickettsiales bacterium]|nr:2-C-methyl-D-erythritol 2,4-cyclodiphosphate synthase [Rickettsiales bacterium]
LGLKSLEHLAPDYVLIHDAARPLVSAALIRRVIEALAEYPAVIPGIPEVDTVKEVIDGQVTQTLRRETLVRAQTPQGFHFATIWDAHQRAQGQNLTDDAAIAEAAGINVQVVQGEVSNFKLTGPEDIKEAERMIQASKAAAAMAQETRMGMGVDVHAYAEINEDWDGMLKLCGVEVPYERALRGHSDADVGLHALVDALLGAVAAGDIGQHFPPSDPQWEGADSAVFVAGALEQVKAKGGRVQQVDITLICEAPKISPYREAMQQRVAALLGVAPERVNIKATTTEGLGFTGRREGIAAQAIATVVMG